MCEYTKTQCLVDIDEKRTINFIGKYIVNLSVVKIELNIMLEVKQYLNYDTELLSNTQEENRRTGLNCIKLSIQHESCSIHHE